MYVGTLLPCRREGDGSISPSPPSPPSLHAALLTPWWVACCDSSRFGRRDSTPLPAPPAPGNRKATRAADGAALCTIQRSNSWPGAHERQSKGARTHSCSLPFLADGLTSRDSGREPDPRELRYSTRPSPRLPIPTCPPLPFRAYSGLCAGPQAPKDCPSPLAHQSRWVSLWLVWFPRGALCPCRAAVDEKADHSRYRV